MYNQLKSAYHKARQQLTYALGRVFVRTDGKLKNRSILLESLHNKYEGKRCFLLGNGPSLNAADLEKLKGEITFASNGIFKIFSETDWHPTYYFIMDESVAQRKGVVEGASKIDCEMKFFREEGYLAYRNISGNCCFLHSWFSRKYLNHPQFSMNPKKGIYTIATVMYSMVQLAAYMGFKEIYILGCDNNYSIMMQKDGTIVHDKATNSYFGKQTEEEKKVVAAIWEMNIAYAYAEEFSRKNGFRIFNATRGGRLESFERVDFDTLF